MEKEKRDSFRDQLKAAIPQVQGPELPPSEIDEAMLSEIARLRAEIKEREARLDSLTEHVRFLIPKGTMKEDGKAIMQFGRHILRVSTVRTARIDWPKAMEEYAGPDAIAEINSICACVKRGEMESGLVSTNETMKVEVSKIDNKEEGGK